MEKYIERLLDGQFEYDRGSLEFSEQRIEVTLLPGSTAEGSFRVYGPADKPVEGHVSSTEIRMKVLTPVFSGSEDTISWRFDARHLSSGDVLQGSFRIVSNRGEYMVPFVVTMDAGHVDSTMGEIRNLFHFTNLAKTDWKQARQLFMSDGFSEILSGHDAQYLSVYRGLRNSPDSGRALEEFLIATRKKQPVVFMPDQTEIRMESPDILMEESLSITRNGWGYTSLTVTADGAFLSVDRQELKEADFVGNTCRFRYRIDPAKLHAGNNFGSLVFHTAYETFRVGFLIHRTDQARAVSKTYLRKKKLTVSLMKLYESFRMRRISAGKWLQDAADLTGRMRTTDEDDLAFALYYAHYLITASREPEGMRLLDELRPSAMNTNTPDELRCYYLYLTTLVDREVNVDAVARQIRSAYFGNPGDWRIAWLLQFVSEEYANPSRKWELFKEQYERGSRSPLICIEALHIASSYPATLMRLDSFEIAMLRLAVREKLLPAQLIDRVVYLARHRKQYDRTVFEALTACYEMEPRDETLVEICAVLIRGQRTDETALFWYTEGVNRNLRLTRLYEYYMMSVKPDANGAASCDIPRAVLMYFSHGSDLDRHTNALLYRYVSDHREAYADLYSLYEKRILAFVSAQIAQGYVDATLAQLYKRYFRPEMVNASNAGEVLRVLHTCLITVAHPDISEVIVIYDKLRDERRYRMTEGEAVMPLYGGDYTIMLEDRFHNRYADGIPFDTHKFMIPGRLTQSVEPFMGEGNDYIDYFLCGQQGGVYSITMENVSVYRALVKSDMIEENCRKEIKQQLIRFYHENDFTRQLTEALQEEDLARLPQKRRSEILELMVVYGLADRAFSWMKTFGTHGTDPKIVMRLCSRLSDYGAYRSDRAAVEVMYYAFRKGKYDNNVLEFLKETFDGTVREMRDVWKAASSFGVDTGGLSERIILQMLYSNAYVGERMEIFRDYIQQGSSGDTEIAFLAQSAYDHFVRESVTGEFIYRRIGRLLASGTVLPDICGMDYLKFFAGHRTGEFDLSVAERILADLADKDIYFPFFTEYTDVLPGTRRFADRVMLQYRTAPGKRCVVHYVRTGTEEDETGGATYSKKRMREMYDSIYCASFVLFFGEELQYYITEADVRDDTDGEGEQLTESGSLSRNDVRQIGTESDRFTLINDLCVAEALKDYETFDRLLREYYHTGFLAEYLFRVKETDYAVKRT